MPRRMPFALAAIVLGADPAWAHHSPAPFDLEQTITIEGVVARYLWASPHVYIDLEVTREDGGKELWEVEAAWPAAMMLRGWSPETLEAGDAVVVTGNPGRSAARRIVLGRSLVHDGTTMVLNVEPNSPPPDTSVTDEDRTGTPPAEALLGTWLPQVQAFSIFLAPEPRLTDSAQAALRAGNLRYMESEQEAASCIAHRPPLNMTFQEPKRFESRGNDIVIRVVVDGDVERIVHMNGALGDGGAPGRQGYSVGRWENDALIVETTFDANEGEGRGLFDGIPLAGTLLVERFELSRDRKRLNYVFSVENPEYLVEPYMLSAEWVYRPDIELPRLECDGDIAERFIEN